ncbi:MAG: hypothetical protein GW778_08950 [Alphaproteobacteria bacterium]|nr:hypothetical protein [Alphaproteobacteria bacterium]
MASGEEDINIYDPSAVIMRGVHLETGEERLLSASDVEGLRADPASGFRRKEWAFSCPCCGDLAKAKHVKAEKRDRVSNDDTPDTKPKRTHWRLPKGNWHGDPECDLFSPLEAVMRKNNIPVQRRASDNLHELRLRHPKISEDIEQSFHQSVAPRGQKPSKKTASKYVTISHIEELYNALSDEEKNTVIIKEGGHKTLLSDLRLNDRADLERLLESGQSRYFIAPVFLDWNNPRLSGQHEGYFNIRGEFDGIAVSAVVSAEVLGLYDSGRISRHNAIVMGIDAQRHPDDPYAIRISGVVKDVSDFSRTGLLPSVPGVGGQQIVMGL